MQEKSFSKYSFAWTQNKDINYKFAFKKNRFADP